MPASKMDILAISGSLRKGSFNAALLRIAQSVAPDDVAIELYDYSDLPLYNGDLEAAGFPAAATRFKERILKADAILFAAPEYNYSVPGVLKNAIDWAARPFGQSAWKNKPAAVMGGGGGLGAARSQYHLRQIAAGLDMHMLSKPEIFVSAIGTKIDAEGKLTDPVALGLITQLVVGLRDWTRRLAEQA
jgi:chromate reductase